MMYATASNRSGGEDVFVAVSPVAYGCVIGVRGVVVDVDVGMSYFPVNFNVSDSL